MKYLRYLWLLLGMSPLLAFAESSALNFTPHAGDLSALYLYFLFGNIPPVLAGSGTEVASQIIGQMFGVFNSAVLAIGGVILMYTFIVSTLNTAHEGEVLGKKWSSIWTPLRAVLAVALMLPTKSGFCMIQVVTMWVVLQGIGAANSVWFSTLDYLEKGGVFFQIAGVSGTTGTTNTPGAGGYFQTGVFQPPEYESNNTTAEQQANNANSTLNAATVAKDQADKLKVAQDLLWIAICLKGVEQNLKDANEAAILGEHSPLPPSTPNFAGMVALEQATPESAMCYKKGGTELGCAPYGYKVAIPNSLPNVYFQPLAGLCGTISWQTMSDTQKTTLTSSLSDSTDPTAPKVTSDQKDWTSTQPPLTSGTSAVLGALTTRAQAIQAMFDNLSGVADSIVANFWKKDPKERLPLGSCEQCGSDTLDALWVGSGDKSPLLSGYELNQAVNLYYSIVQPSLRVPNEDINKLKAFIVTARRDGWIMAGAYFFQLAQLNDIIAKIGSDSGTVTVKPNRGAINLNAGAISQLFFSVEQTGNSSSGSRTFPVDSLGYNNFTPFMDLLKYLAEDEYTEYLSDSAAINRRKLGDSIPRGGDFNLKLEFSIPLSLEKDYCMGGSIFGWCPSTDLWNFMIKNFVNPIIIKPINDYMVSAFVAIFAFVPNIWKDALEAMSVLTRSTMHPILGVASFGRGLVDLAGNAVMDIMVQLVLAAINPLFAFVVGFAILLVPLLATLLISLFLYGVTLAFWAPIIPFTVFVFGAIAWFITVVEAMVAAPIVALGMMHPDGEDVMGKAQPALLLLLGVFLRPTLMIIGLIFGIIFSFISLILVNKGFLIFVDTFTAQAKGWVGILTPFAMVAIYCVLTINVIQRSFDLIHMLPDRVLRWIGGGDSIGGDISRGQVEAMKSGVEGAASSGMEAAKSAGSKIASGGKSVYASNSFKGKGSQAQKSGGGSSVGGSGGGKDDGKGGGVSKGDGGGKDKS